MEQLILEGVIWIGMIIGIFGNTNVIVAILRKKILRTKGAMFVFIMAVCHLICNISEIIGLVFQFRFLPMARRDCFEYNIIYAFAIMFQTALYFSMALDLCFSILLPIKHMLWKKAKYVAVMCIFPTVFAFSTNLISYLYISDDNAPYCLFILTTDPNIYQIVSSAIVVLNCVTLIVVLCSVVSAVRKSSIMRSSRHSSSTSSRTGSLKEEKHKVFRSTFFMLAVYIGSWMSTAIIFKIMINVVKNEDEIMDFEPYLMVILMPNYAQAYFITYMRSPRFRKAFREQLNWITCGLLFPSIFDVKRRVDWIGRSATNSANQGNNESESKKREGSTKSIRFANKTDL